MQNHANYGHDYVRSNARQVDAIIKQDVDALAAAGIPRGRGRGSNLSTFEARFLEGQELLVTLHQDIGAQLSSIASELTGLREATERLATLVRVASFPILILY